MEDGFIGLAILIGLGIFFAPLILSIVALSRTGDLRRKITVLEGKLASHQAAGPVPEAAPAADAPSAAATGKVWAEASQVADKPIAVEPPPEPVIEQLEPVEASGAVDAAGPPPLPPAATRAGIEERLASRWLVWLGAVALVFAGIFLIKYSIENALLTPAMRATFGLVLGIALTAAGEWLRRRPLQKQLAAVKPDYVPGALTSAGLFISFASIYAAYGLLDLLSPTVAFIGLAIVALVAFALAALHSPIVAIIGLLAGFATPGLVSSNEPNAAILFAYLALIAAAAYAVVIYRGWGWLAYGATIGGLLWTCAWILGAMQARDLMIIAAFLAVLSAAAIWLALRLTPDDAPVIWEKPHQPQGPEFNGWLAVTGSVGLMGLAASFANAPMVSLVLAAIGAVALAYAGRRFQRFDGLIAHAAALLLITLLVWDVQDILDRQLIHDGNVNFFAISAPLFPREAKSFVLSYLFSGALIAGLGFFMLRGSARPAVWAGISLLGALLILAAAYAKSRLFPIFFTTDLLWALTATAAAGLAVTLAGTLNKKREERPYRLALGFYAAAALAGVSFAFAFVFHEAWLTVALALQLPALAWLEKTLDLKELRKLALAVAAVILARLALNPYVLSYETNHALGTQWILYGYGIPALAFFVAGWMFRQRLNDLTVTVMESGAFVFALLLVALEIRIFTEGRIASEEVGLFELSLHTLVWLAAGWWRLRNYAASGRAVDKWWAIILIGLGLAGVIIGQFLVLNPLFSYESIGNYPIFNQLLVAYLAPAVLIGLIGYTAPPVAGLPQLRIVFFAMALTLILTWVTLETKRAFQGPVLDLWAKTDGEYYAYSVVWLISSLVLLGIGLWRKAPWLRHGALAILILTVCKVFLSDMAALGGLYRVASFLGLGLFLVGIGYIYQRYVFTGKKADENVAKA
ncbi:DUF2339 domain-containing protein [Taklimakanibacter lacteus]|uniref:DUF2339 domain-containing protein n=1 Tax=Taklimakanibacter lacteus TaxID=2268456 RepID=UPI000E667C4F